MSREVFIPYKLRVVEQANGIIRKYEEQGSHVIPSRLISTGAAATRRAFALHLGRRPPP
jgi:hypothetical protein